MSRLSVRSFRRARNSLPARRPFGGPGEEEELLRVLEREQSPDGVEMREPGHVLDALATGGPRARDDHLADELRFVLSDHLGDHAAHGEAEEVDLVETQRPDEGDGVLGHRLDGVRRRAGGRADAPVVERDDPVLRGDAVDDPRVPVVEDRGQVGEEDDRDTGLRAELAVGEIHATGGDGAGRCVLERRDHLASCLLFVLHGHSFCGRDSCECCSLTPSRRAVGSRCARAPVIAWER